LSLAEIVAAWNIFASVKSRLDMRRPSGFCEGYCRPEGGGQLRVQSRNAESRRNCRLAK
jgi:hypothetical protein